MRRPATGGRWGSPKAAGAASPSASPSAGAGLPRPPQVGRPDGNGGGSPRRPRDVVVHDGGDAFGGPSPSVAAAAAAAPGDSRSAAGRARGAPPPLQQSLDGVPNPDTPPPLRGIQRRGSLVSQDAPEDEPKEQIEPELMIGEIQVCTRVCLCLCVLRSGNAWVFFG